MTDTYEIQTTEIILPDGRMIPAEFFMREITPELVELSLRFLDRDVTRIERTFWGALILIREELESDKILIKCYGCSKDVYPSGMSLDMGTGDKAIKKKMGEPTTMKDVVWIFDTGSDVIPSTIKEQREFLEVWAKSISKPT